MEIINDAAAFLNSNAGIVLFSLIVVVVLLLLLNFVTAFRVNSLSKPLKKLKKKSSADEIVAGILKAIDANQSDIAKLASDFSDLSQRSRYFLQRTAVARYDAFEDIGGKQSFSLCLLDDHRNGYLLTYLTGRNSARSYVVEIANGQAPRKLSHEEQMALDEALSFKKLSPAAAG